jgi:hypothetical protein
MRFVGPFLLFLYLLIAGAPMAFASNTNCILNYAALGYKAQIDEAPIPELRGAAILTASSIEKNRASLSFTQRMYFNSFNGILTRYGTLGPTGPLQQFGPVGNNFWNASNYISSGSSQDWSKFSAWLTKNEGPLSGSGVFSDWGAGGKHASDLLPFFGLDARLLQEGNAAAIAGPLGPHGAYGANGPLGPIGAHGFVADPISGRYLKDGKPLTKIQAGKGNTYQLVEYYSQQQAQTLSKKNTLDSSFLMDGKLNGKNAQELNIKAEKDTWLSVLAIPDKTYGNVSVELVAKDGTVIALSESRSFVNFVQIRVPSNQPFTIRVRSLSSTLEPQNFRLHVTSAPARPLDHLEAASHLTFLK